MKRNNLTQEKLFEIFESIDTLGLGNPEFMIFEEINVYLIAPVIIRNYSDEKVAQIFSYCKNNGKREYERIWYGVQIFKKEYEKIDKLDFNKNKFIWGLIEIYYEKWTILRQIKKPGKKHLVNIRLDGKKNLFLSYIF
jgi:hypothetical protein